MTRSTTCSWPGCNESRPGKQTRCAEHNRIYMREFNRRKRYPGTKPSSGEEKVMVIDTNGDVLIMKCVEIERIPAKAFKSRTTEQNPLMHFFDFLRWRGFRLVQLIVPDVAADAVDDARHEKMEVA